MGSDQAGKERCHSSYARGYLLYGREQGVFAAPFLRTDGRARPLSTGQAYSSPHVSPDGQRVALEIGSDIWIYDFAANNLTRLTPGLRVVGWTKDSRRVVFLAPDSTVVRQLWDRTAPATEFIRLPVQATTFTMGPRHGFGAFSVLDPKTLSPSGHIWVAPLDSPSAARPYVVKAAHAVDPRMSHNGELLA